MLIIGDVHGCINLLEGLLTNVEDEDIYFVGDLIDRGKKSIETLKYVMGNGYKVIMGNHEKLMLDFILYKNHENKRWWYECGGKVTHKAFEYKISPKERGEILNYLKKLPYYYYLENENIFISHAGLKWYHIDNSYGDEKSRFIKLINMQKPDDFIWTRKDFYNNEAFGEYKTILVAGHTPTHRINIYLMEPQILRRQNKFLIDCCAYDKGILAALQIIDNQVIEHYFSEDKGYYFHGPKDLR